jgi:O-antigen/teichoic acid export membrane protein
VLHNARKHAHTRRGMPQLLTVDENSFPNPKLRFTALVAYKTGADVAAKAALLVITVVAARRLSAGAFGLFAVGSTLGWILAVAADSGIQMHVARAIGRTPGAAANLLARWLRVRIWTAATSVAVAVTGLALLRVGADAALPIAALVLAYGASGIVEFFYYVLRGLSRSDLEASLTLGHRAATAVLALAALAWHPTAVTLAVAMLIPASIAVVVSWRIVRSTVRTASPSSMPERSSGRSLSIWSEFRHDVFPIGAGIALSALYFRIDVFLVQLWSGTESVGVYNAVFRLVEALRLFPAAALAVALPALCRATDTRPLARVSFGLTAFGVAVAALVWIKAGWIVPLAYGDAYAAGVPAFRILALAFPLMSLNYALTQQLIAWDGHRAFAVLCVTALGFNVFVNARLIPALSIEGAAWATLGTEVVLTIGCGVALVMTMRTAAWRAPLLIADRTQDVTV